MRFERLFAIAAGMVAAGCAGVSAQNLSDEAFGGVTPETCSAENPMLIRNVADMEAMQTLSQYPGRDLYVKMEADINMAGMSWTPLNYADPYNVKIIFDGDGHTIRNFSCDYERYPSFFGVLYGECRNVVFENAVITGGSSPCGVVGGYVGTGGKPGVVENVAIVKGQVSTGNNNSGGGIAGKTRNSTIRNCYVDADITTTYSEWWASIASVAGDIPGDDVTIENCYAAGNIDGGTSANGAGIWGNVDWKARITCSNNISWINLRGNWSSGLVGGRTKGTITADNNYANKNAEIDLYENGQPTSRYYYTGTVEGLTMPGAGNDNDRAMFGILTTDAVAAAKTLGWDESVWTLEGDAPCLKIAYDAVSGVEAVNCSESATVVTSEYYDIAGRRLGHAPEAGIGIRRDTMSDGTVRSVKVAF